MAAVDELNVGGVHVHGVASVGHAIGKPHAAAGPEGFFGVCKSHVFERHFFAVAEHLRGFDARLFHRKVLDVPDRGTAARGKKGIPDGRRFAVPERIFAFEAAVFGREVFAVLKGAFARKDRDV